MRHFLLNIPKFVILVSFIHPLVVPNLTLFYFLLNTKEDILNKTCSQAVLITIDFHFMATEKNTETFLKISSFIFIRT